MYQKILEDNNIDRNNWVKVLQKLTDGCRYRFFADALVEGFLNNNNNKYNDEKFKSLFGFSIQDDDVAIDNTILMLDLFCSIYNLSRFEICEFDIKEYSSFQEAAKELSDQDFDIEREAVLKLFEIGYKSDGTTEDGNIRLKSRIAKRKYQMIGTYADIARHYGIDEFSEKGLREALEERGITFSENEKDMEAKLNGHLGHEATYWMNYYLSLKKSNLSLECIVKSYDQFVEYLSEVEDIDFTVGISCVPSSQVKYCELNMNWSYPMSDKQFGHILKFVRFDDNGNIIVKIQDKELLIEKKYIDDLLFIIVRVKGFTDEKKYSSKK